MRLGICISNERPKIDNNIYKLFQEKFKKEFGDWSEKFIHSAEELNLDYGVVKIDHDDWISEVKKYDILIWKPQFMGPQSSQFFREKVYFIQHIMKKRIYPNYETVWHFDSKFGQKYLFEYQNIKTPETFASHSYNDVVEKASKADYPLVYKLSNGAGGTNVKLFNSKKKLLSQVNKDFFYNRLINMFMRNSKRENFGSSYIQKFIEGNSADLRINIIGDKYGVGFWRKNRKNDFRASGSGNIDYVKNIPKEILEYCLNISKTNKYDSMAYDILFTNNDFVVVEMSYGFNDKAFYNTRGFYEFNSDGKIKDYQDRKTWPQKLWVKWMIEDSNLNNNN